MKLFSYRPDSGHQNSSFTLACLWVLLFFNSAGTWSSWLVLGPYVVTADVQLLITFGSLALVRQLFGFAGVLVGETWPFKIKTESANRYIEWTLVLINLCALVCVWTLPDHLTFAWAGTWSLVRFFVGGVSLVFGYRLILELTENVSASDRKSIASSSLVGQLAVGQGSVIIGSLLSFAFALLTAKSSITTALAVDTISSLIFAAWLARLKLPAAVSTQTDLTLFKKFRSSMSGLFSELPARSSATFLLGLLAITSLPTIFMYLSRTSGNAQLPQFYSAMNFINGFCLLIAAYQVSNGKHWFFGEKNFYYFGMAVMLVGCALGLLLPEQQIPAGLLFITSGLLSLGSTSALLALHKLIMGKYGGTHAATVRSSMALYLNLVFGFSELLCAVLADRGHFKVWIAIKAFAGLGSLVLILSDHVDANKRV